jgi:hypothetical protein
MEPARIWRALFRAPGLVPGQRGGGCEVRTREGLPPTRFPTMLASVHRRPPPSVSWADRDGWVWADTREPRRMRPHLRPAGPAGRCRQRGPHPAAGTVPALACSSGGPRGLTALADAEPAVTIACWLICPAQVTQAPGHTASPAVAHGPRTPSACRIRAPRAARTGRPRNRQARHPGGSRCRSRARRRCQTAARSAVGPGCCRP